MDAETEYIGELKGLYASLSATQTSDLQWPPPCTHKVFNLAMIKEEVERGKIKDTFVRMTITGKLDDILHVKTPIKLKNIFDGVKPNKRKVVLMEGAPGCGKSTLANFISQQWGEDKLFAELMFKAVVLVRLRDPVIQKATSIVDLFPSGDDISTARRAVESMQTSNFQDILFILDGWDELPKDLREDSIFRKLIQDDLAEKHGLTNSAVIVTSRPVASGDLHKIVSTRIEILGFTPEELHDYFQECLGGNSEAVKTLMERIEENPEIAGTCYLPLNASILVHLFKHCHDSNLPTSQYGIFSLLVCTCISRHLKERPQPSLETLGQLMDTEIVQERTRRKNLSLETLDEIAEVVREPFQFLCDLAYNGVMNDRITFSSLPDNTNTLSILHGVESFVKHADKVKSYNFIHLSIQELLAAFYVAKWLEPEEQVSKFNELFDNPRFSAVFQFYSAITKLQNPGITDILTKAAKRCYDENDDEAKILLVSLFHCLNAAQDSSLCELVMKCLQYELDLAHTTLNPTDCLCIGYFLSCACSLSTCTSTSEFRVELDNCDIGDKGCKYLVRGLQKYLTTSDHTSTTLYMSLQWSNIEEEGSIELSRILQYNCVDTLKLNENETLSDQGVFHIAEKLKTNKSLIELQLNTCGLTTKGVGYIADALKINKSLRFLNIGGNKICDEGVKCLANALGINDSLESLDISSCGMGDLGLKHIIDSLECNKSLKTLEMYNFQNQEHLNEITDMDHAIECLTDIISKTTALQSLVLPKEFEASLPIIQKRINEERECHDLEQLKVDVEGQTLKTIRENVDTDSEEMEVESPLNETDVDQNDVNNTKEHANFQTSIEWRSESSEFYQIQKSVAFLEAEQKVKVPFLHHEVLECDHSGLQYTNPDHDISINIPEGAVSEGDIVHFEFGVTMFGPFKFVGSARPISPIVWVCLLEESYELKKPYQVILPHILTQLSSESLQYHQVKVTKAEHRFFSNDEENRSYKFHPCGIEPIFGFIGHKSYAALESLHFCFYCLEANQTLELDKSIGYCLVRVIQESIPNKVYFLAMYFLGTCLRSLEEQFPSEEGYKIDDRKEFKFKDSAEPDTEPYLRINISPEHHEVIALEPMNSEIKASDIDFWKNKYDIKTMRLKHDVKTYPPRVKMTIPAHPGFKKLPITFEGYSSVCQSLDMELFIPLAEDTLCRNKNPWPWHCSHDWMTWYNLSHYLKQAMDKKRAKRDRSGRKRAMSEREDSVSRKARKKFGESKSASMGDEPRFEGYHQIQPISMRKTQVDHNGWLFTDSASSATSIIPTTDLAQPNLGNLTVIVWTNKEGKQKYFRLQESICDKWILIGDLLHMPYLLLGAWKHKNPLDCIRLVLTYWFKNGSPAYSVSWEGVYELLDDAELTNFVAPLKEAIENAQSFHSSQSMIIPEIDSASSDDEPFTNSSDSASSQSTVEKDSVTPPRKYVNIPDSDHCHAAVLERSGCEYVETSRHAPITDRHTIWLTKECQGEFAASKFSSTLQVRPDEAVLPSAQLGISIQQPGTSTSATSVLAGREQLTYDSNIQHPSMSSSEYLSISSGATEDVSDISKPTAANLTVIKWKNEREEVKKFRLKQSIIHKWRKIGNLVVPRQQLEVWAKRMDDEECYEAVLSHWLDHPPRHYPATWEGLYELLDDSELGQVAIELRQAVDNAI